MTTSLYPWQSAPWQTLHRLRERLPHAILFHGPAGIGKTAFAERFAQSLLCQAPAGDGQPCGNCGSCGWFDQYSHPDYRRVRPEALENDQAADAEDGEAGEGRKSGKSAKTPSREIRIDQIRGLADFMNVSTHRQGRRVILLYPAETLNTIAANALLKTLEEPQPATVFLLVSNSLDRLLPTILSRCRKFALPMPEPREALDWLGQQGVAEPDIWLAEQGGAPLSAHAQAQSENREAMNDFLRQLANPGVDSALRIADKMQKIPLAELTGWLQRWLHDLFSFKLAGRIRYYPRYGKELAILAQRTEVADLLRALKTVQQRRGVADHPLSAKLFIEDMLLDYASLFAS